MKKLLLLIASLGLILFSCTSESDSSTSGDNYNRTNLLTNWADNIIIPSYENYQAKVVLLNDDVTSFVNTPNQTNLNNLRTSWLNAYKAYQYIGFINVGKAEELNLSSCTNVYPINVTGIESNISSGSYDFSLLSQFDKQGFPALDYMLNGLAGSDVEIINFYTSNSNASNYKQYLSDLSSKLKSNIDLIVNDWNSTYRTTFISSNGNSVSSSVNRMVNSYVKHFEKDIRAGKVGIPAGIYSNGILFPEKVESYYKNDVSLILLNESIKASKDFFNGKHFNSSTEGMSLKSYLDFLNTIRDGQNLSTIINNQFTTINSTNSNLSASLSSQVNSNNSLMISSFDAMQQNVVYFKLDMMQAFNITVDYVDADGD